MKTVTAILKILLIILLTALLFFGVFLLSRTLAWPDWALPAALGGLAALIGLIAAGRKLYYRRRESSYLRQVISEGGESLSLSRENRADLLTLRQAFEKGLELLRRSPLELRGNPLTVQPWFIMLGPPGSGKTFMLDQAEFAHALLASPGAMGAPSSYCDWRFGQKAVILDTAGRFCVPDNPADDLEQWQELLRLLASQRPGKPVDGVVLTVPVDLLLANNDLAIEEVASASRQRLEELMALSDEAPPVFVMLSKMDLLPGTDDLAALLRGRERGQGLGVLNSLAQSPPIFLADVLDEIISLIKERRLALCARRSGHHLLLGLPAQLEALAPPLAKFFAHLAENPYQQPLNLRGIFLSSARSQSRPAQDGPDSAELTSGAEGRQKNPGRESEGLFLKDFFGSILPGERYAGRINPKTKLARARRQAARLSLWLLFLLAVLAYGSNSYQHLRQAQDKSFMRFPTALALNGDFVHDSMALSEFQDGIEELESDIRSGWFNGLFKRQGRQSLDMLKEQFCRLYRQAVLEPMNRQLAEAQRLYSGDDGNLAFTYSYLSNLIWRLDLLSGHKTEQIQSTEGEAMRAVVMAFGPNTPDISPDLGEMYIAYLNWRGGSIDTERDIARLKEQFNSLIQDRGMPWLFDWIIQHASSAPPVRLSVLWAVPLAPEYDYALASAFTQKGRQQVARLLASLARLFPNNELTSFYEQEFWRRYHDQYCLNWLQLTEKFNYGVLGLDTHGAWINRAGGMSGLQSPYLSYLLLLNSELSAVKDLASPPAWVLTCRRLAEIISSQSEAEETSTLVRQVTGLLRETVDKTAAEVSEHRYDERSIRLQAREAFSQYLKQLAEFMPGISSPQAGFIMAQSGYLGSQSGRPAPSDMAMTHITTISNLLGTGDENEGPIWRVLEGPLAFLAAAINQQAALQLNDYWTDQVSSQTIYAAPDRIWNLLFDDSGLIADFVENYAKGFLIRDNNGWQPNDWLGLTLPFTAEFLSLLNAGWHYRQVMADSYRVAFSAIPPLVSPASAVKPNLVGLYLQGGEEEQFLENYNYPAEATFIYTPGQSGDTSLMIAFDHFTAKKTWSGPNGFPDFLNAFPQGSATFVPEDFPETTALLRAEGIESLTIRYGIKGAESLRRDGGRPKLKVPETATQTWNSGSPHYYLEAMDRFGFHSRQLAPKAAARQEGG